MEQVYPTGVLEVVYNLRVAGHHTYFVGDETWGWAAWAHNAYTAEVNAIIKQVVTAQGGTAGSGFSYDASRTGERATWANRPYLVEHLRAMVGKYYPGLAAAVADQVASCAATRILRLPQVVQDRQSHPPEEFNPQTTENYRPSSSAVPAGLSGIAHRQYTISNSLLGVQNLAPVTADLNYGGWEVRLADQLGDTPGRKARGVYVIRDTVTGRIYKVGKADGTGLVKRLESYAKDWVARGNKITAEVYKLPGDLLTAERVLRGAVRDDGWLLDPPSGAADGTFDETKPQGTGSWTVTGA